MSDFSTSFASLVKSNNGMFKSEKQAAFLLAQCDAGTFVASGHGWAGWQLHYRCDALGVVEVCKHTAATGRAIVWQRVEAGRVAVQETKEHKRLTRMRTGVEKDLSARTAARTAGSFSDTALFDAAQARDMASLTELDAMLARLR